MAPRNVGDAAPNFTLVNAAGEVVSLEPKYNSFLGEKAVVVNGF